MSDLPADTKSEILKKRAHLLARRFENSGEKGAEVIDAVEFMLADEHYAIESAHIAEVFPLTQLTPVPCTPEFVLGIVNVRGRMVPVVNLKKFFDMPEKGITGFTRIVILRSPEMELGLVTDLVVGSIQIPTADIQATLPTLTGVREEFLRGVGKDDLVILDANKILSDENLIVNEEVK